MRSLRALLHLFLIALLTLPVSASPRLLRLLPPVVPHGFGLNIHFTGAPTQKLDSLQESGVGWVRMDFFWGGIEKQPGVYDFSAYDALIGGLAARHISAIFILDYGNDLYQKGPPRSPTARAAFARFAAAAVKRFAGKPVLWELWNEPNGAGFWPPRPDAAEYATLALTAARAIKAADPQAIILAPGSSGMPLDYLETVFKSGLLSIIDAVSVHPYRGQAPETAGAEYQAVRQLISRYAPSGKDVPLISSEWGYTTVTVTEERQAQYLARQWLFNLSENVPLSIWYDWQEDGTNPTDGEHHFGTVHPDFSPKPAFLAMKTLTSGLSGYRFVKRIPLASEEDYLLLFAEGKDHLRLAAWTTGRDHPILLPVQGDVQSMSLLGTPRTVTSGDVLTIPLSNSPQYLTVDPNLNPALLSASRWILEPVSPFYTAAHPASLRFTYVNPDTQPHKVKFLLAVSATPGSTPSRLTSPERTVGGGQTETWTLMLPLASRVALRARAALVRDGHQEPYPQDTRFTPSDPLTLSAAPAGKSGFQIQISNPAATAFSGFLDSMAGTQKTHFAVSLPTGKTLLAYPLPGQPDLPTAFTLRDRAGQSVAALPARRFVPYPFAPQSLSAAFEGDPKAKSTLKTVVQPVTGGRGDVFRIDYRFGPGWTYWRAGEGSPTPIEGRPAAFGLWVFGDASGELMRMRFNDTTGQTFQPDGGSVNWQGWRFVTFPLRPTFAGNMGHWGGAKDGVLHYPLTIESLFLLDSQSGAKKPSGTIALSQPTVIYDGVK